jgi:O-antigen/teichoic acid export membrane protein
MAGVRKNLAATLYSTATSIGGQIVLVPIYLHFWGAERYGWWLVLYAIPASFTFLDAGISNSLGNALTIAYHRKEIRQAQRMLNAVWKYQTLGLGIGFAVFATGILTLPVRRWLALERLGATEFVIASLVLCAYALLSIQLGVFTAIFRAAGRFDQFVRWNAHARWVEVGANAFALAYGSGIIGAAATLLSVRATFLALYWLCGRNLLPELKMTWSDAPWIEFRTLLATGLAFMALPAGMGILNQGSAILLNHQLGPIAVVALSVSRQLARLYLNIINALFVALHPELTSAYAGGDRERLRSLYAAGLGVVAWTAAPAVLALVIAGPFVIDVWTKSAVVVGHMLMMACGAEAVVAVLGNNAALPAYASNRHVAACTSFLLCTAAGFLPATLLVNAGGVTVVPASFAATGIIFAVHAFFASSAIVEARPRDIFWLSINPAVLLRLAFGGPPRQMPAL